MWIYLRENHLPNVLYNESMLNLNFSLDQTEAQTWQQPRRSVWMFSENFRSVSLAVKRSELHLRWE